MRPNRNLHEPPRARARRRGGHPRRPAGEPLTASPRPSHPAHRRTEPRPSPASSSSQNKPPGLTHRTPLIRSETPGLACSHHPHDLRQPSEHSTAREREREECQKVTALKATGREGGRGRRSRSRSRRSREWQWLSSYVYTTTTLRARAL